MKRCDEAHGLPNFAALDVAKGICHRTKELVLADAEHCEHCVAIQKCKFCVHFVAGDQYLGTCDAVPSQADDVSGPDHRDLRQVRRCGYGESVVENAQRRTPRGLIFDIQGHSIHDGPGARTLVFLSGCPFRCTWCSNPEGLLLASAAHVQVTVLQELPGALRARMSQGRGAAIGEWRATHRLRSQSM